MNISLTPEPERIVKSRVDSGLYNNASEVIREALRLMAEQERVETMKLEWRRAEIDLARHHPRSTIEPGTRATLTAVYPSPRVTKWFTQPDGIKPCLRWPA